MDIPTPCSPITPFSGYLAILDGTAQHGRYPDAVSRNSFEDPFEDPGQSVGSRTAISRYRSGVKACRQGHPQYPHGPETRHAHSGPLLIIACVQRRHARYLPNPTKVRQSPRAYSAGDGVEARTCFSHRRRDRHGIFTYARLLDPGTLWTPELRGPFAYRRHRVGNVSNRVRHQRTPFIA